MSTNPAPKILLTGATGYIGGTILRSLLANENPHLASSQISVLVRGDADRIAGLQSAYGPRIETYIYEGLDDLPATTAAAAEHDLIINTTHGFHSPSSIALLTGLAQRKSNTNRPVFLIHTSGTSNLADHPITKSYVHSPPDREFDDEKDDVYGFERMLGDTSPYPQRTAELKVIDKGLELGVQTLVIMSPLIFGTGTGVGNTVSLQIPAYAKATVNYGRGLVVEGGHGVWDHVHVRDLAELYTIVALDMLANEGKGLPQGKKGIIFSGNGRHSWLEAAQGVADAAYEAGKIKTREVESVDLKKAAGFFEIMGMRTQSMVERGLSSNSRTVSSVGRRLGWKPVYNEKAWRETFKEGLGQCVDHLKL